jgi:hypothetical protein
MDAPAKLIDVASEDLRSALRPAAASGLGVLEASHAPLARSVARLESAVAQWARDPASRGRDAQHALERFQAQLRIHAALHLGAGALCAEWRRALGGPGGQAYSPAGEGLPALLVRSHRVSVEA